MLLMLLFDDLQVYINERTNTAELKKFLINLFLNWAIVICFDKLKNKERKQNLLPLFDPFVRCPEL